MKDLLTRLRDPSSTTALMTAANTMVEAAGVIEALCKQVARAESRETRLQDLARRFEADLKSCSSHLDNVGIGYSDREGRTARTPERLFWLAKEFSQLQEAAKAEGAE